MMRLLSRRGAIGLACLAFGLPLVATSATALAQGANPPTPRVSTSTDGGGYHQTRTVTRDQVVNGATQNVESDNVTVNVDTTKQLRGRQRVNVSWSGAHPSGGRAGNPFGESGMAQEYPVVIMQCRGTDDPSLPADQQLRPETCWTSTRSQRTQSATEAAAVWRHDLYASEADRAQKSGVNPFPDASKCNDVDFLSTHITTFVGAGGKTYLSCTAETMPPEAAVGATYPASEIAAFTDVNGDGHAQFEVRSDVENESLGCNRNVACSIVVIPIMGISCLDSNAQCNQFGRFAPGSSNFAGEGVDAAVSPLYWWSASNWRNRFSVPVSFGLPPDACDVLDNRPPIGFYGSELLSQAAIQWAPAYCLNKKRFKFQHNRMSDAAAFSLMETGQAAAAVVSGPHQLEGTDQVAYAPTAVTGFAISYVADKPDNAGELSRLRLNPRLLAKLLTQSYPASDLGRDHPGMGSNPLSMNLDPEFVKLNPGLDQRAREAAATLLSLSQSSDVMTSLTRYIAQDKDAMSFVSGKKDPWGMSVNPSYQGIHLPVAEWPLKDTFVPTSSQECLRQNPAVYLSQVAAPVSYLRTIAEAVLDSWPNVQTRCDRATPTDPFKLGRVDRQGIGSRFMLGLTSLGDAARFGLATAELETTPGHFVGPSDASMAAALKHLHAAGRLAPFKWDERGLSADARAYPGTMVIYTAARLSNLGKADAAKVSQFIQVSSTEGQRQGPGDGQLPGGYLPLTARGRTAALYAAAGEAAAKIEAQKGGPAAKASPSGPSGGSAAPAAGSTTSAGGEVATSAPVTPGGSAAAQPAAAAPVLVATVATSSGTAGSAVPALLAGLLLLTAGVVALFAGRFIRWGSGLRRGRT